MPALALVGTVVLPQCDWGRCSGARMRWPHIGLIPFDLRGDGELHHPLDGLEGRLCWRA
jgi:hypothetical protein